MRCSFSLKEFKCIQCGNCCLNLSDAFQTSVSDEDIAMWEMEGRFDILEWVHPLVKIIIFMTFGSALKQVMM